MRAVVAWLLLFLLCITGVAAVPSKQTRVDRKGLITTYGQLLTIARLTHNTANIQRFSKRLRQLKSAEVVHAGKTYQASGRCTQCIAFEQKCLGLQACAVPNFEGKCPSNTCDCEKQSDCGM